jgi:hypothetical protein
MYHNIRGAKFELPDPKQPNCEKIGTRLILGMAETREDDSLYSFFASDQRLINQISKALEESVLVVWEMLGKDEHDEFFCRINEA